MRSALFVCADRLIGNVPHGAPSNVAAKRLSWLLLCISMLSMFVLMFVHQLTAADAWQRNTRGILDD